MPWLRAGDNAATHPIVMRVVAFVRGDRSVSERDIATNEVFGWVTRCALQSAGHTTDYVVEEGTALLLGGARTERLLELAKKAGYLTPIKGSRSWRIVDDPEFLHMRLRSEIEWERQRVKDNADPALIVPVRHRDGDQCRYCGFIVNWRSRKGKLAGTYDHREPGQPGTVETLVVACGSCNAGRRDHPDSDDRRPLLPAPTRPFYSATSADFLANHGVSVTATDDLRPGTQPDTASCDPAPSRVPRNPVATRRPAGYRAPSAPSADTSTTTSSTSSALSQSKDNGSADPGQGWDLQISADRLPKKSESPGSGRVGTGDVPAQQEQQQRQSRSGGRSRRGRPR